MHWGVRWEERGSTVRAAGVDSVYVLMLSQHPAQYTTRCSEDRRGAWIQRLEARMLFPVLMWPLSSACHSPQGCLEA